MKIVKEFPQLYAKASTGKLKLYKLWVEEEDGVGIIVKEWGLEGAKIQQNRKRISVGKNLGRSNETSPMEQAIMDAQSDFNSKLDEKYVPNKKDLGSESAILLPMLAHKFTERKHNVVYPCFVQPKLNGIRCIASLCREMAPIYTMGDQASKHFTPPSVQYMSRKGKKFTTLAHLDSAVRNIAGIVGYPLDGELFNLGLNFQEITRLVKKDRGLGDNNPIQYWVYDIVAPDLPFEKRMKLLAKAFLELGSIVELGTGVEFYANVSRVITSTADSEKDIINIHKTFSQNYEGTIIRNAAGLYKCDFRSNDLLKLKDFVDREYLLIGGKKDADGCVVFKCQTDEGLVFDARPRGAREQRKEWLDNLDEIVKAKTYVTVRYQSLSEDLIPVFPVILALRDYE